MKLLWTRSKNPFDWLILKVTGQDCGHFAFLFETAGGGMVFESNLLGTHPAFYKTWMKNRTIVHSKDIPISLEDENILWDKWVDLYDGQPYDLPGCIYAGLMIFRLKFFKIQKPKVNAWGSKKAYYCDEVYQLVSGLPGFPFIDESSNGLDSPHDVWENIK